MHPIVIFIALVGSVIAAVIAQGKNRNALGWAVLGALFPLIAILIVSCQPALPPPTDPP